MTKHGMIKASSAISEEHHITQKYNTYQITEKLLPYNRELSVFFICSSRPMYRQNATLLGSKP